MPFPYPTIENDHTLRRVLGELRGRIRRYVAVEAGLAVLVFLGIVFWGGLALDWMFEPPPGVRLAAHLTIATIVAAMLLWWGVRRWAVRLPDRSLALLLERKFPELSERLSTAVDLGRDDTRSAQLHPELVARTQQSAAESASQLDVATVLNRPRLSRFTFAAVAIAISIAIFALAAPGAWRTYTERLALSPDRWPRTVRLSIEGFEPDGQGGFVRKVARNSDVPIVVSADMEEGYKAPSRVTIRYRWHEGERGRDDLVRIGSAQPGRDAAQRFEYLFERITGSVDFNIRGGDDRLRDMRIEVVERPKVTALQFACEYSQYLNRAARELTVGPRVELPEGTRIVINGKANKPLEKVDWQFTRSKNDIPITTNRSTADFRAIAEVSQNDLDMEISLKDRDGIESAEPFRISIVSKRDQTPQVLVDRRGIGAAVTPSARLPLEVTIEDDYAIDSAWLTLAVDDLPLPAQPIRLPAGARDQLTAPASVDLRERTEAAEGNAAEQTFAPGQRLTLEVAARDRYDLTDEPREGKARPLSFEIVTEEELLARLSSAEQNLRQTFESIADKLLVLYGALDQLESPDDTLSTAPTDATLVVDTSNVEESLEGEEPSAALLRQTARFEQDSRQMTDEILAVASGFEDIHDQIVNNRIDNTELTERIGERIAAPLRELGGQRMAQLSDQIAAIGGGGSVRLAKEETRRAIAEVEALLREMQGLENYNEVIAMLREIIRQQEKINTKTKDKQKTELRDLLMD